MKLIVNDQISLSEVRPWDKPAYVQHLSEKEIYDNTLRIPFPYTDAAADEWLKIVEKTTRQQGQTVHWAIRDETDFLIGGIGFEDFQLGKSHRAEIGYWLAKPYWGRGIMSAVVKRACDFAFTEWGLVKIVAHVFVHNSRSARVLEKCGFQEEGFLRRHHQKEGKYVDARLFGLVK